MEALHGLLMLYDSRRVLGPLFKTNDVVINVSLKFQTLISETCQNFLLKICEELFSFIFQQKIPVYMVIKS